MDINAAFPSNYMKAADLRGQTRQATIESVAMEPLGDGQPKPLVRFRGLPVGLILNRTNGTIIAAAFGPETNNWIGRTIELFPDQVPFRGQVVPAIRVRITAPAAPPSPEPAPVETQPPSLPPTPQAAIPFNDNLAAINWGGAAPPQAPTTLGAPAADIDPDVPL